jgi:hypothetical protein
MSAEPEEGQDSHDHDDQADQIDQAVHATLLVGWFSRLKPDAAPFVPEIASVASRWRRIAPAVGRDEDRAPGVLDRIPGAAP